MLPYRRVLLVWLMIQVAYDNIVGGAPGESTAEWKYIWRKCVPQRVRAFLWLVKSDRLLTNRERVCRHLASSPGCTLCNGGDESVLHALRDCPFTVSIWSRVVKPSELSRVLSLLFADWFNSNLHGRGKFTEDSECWEYLFLVLCWLLWKRRCSLIMDPSFVDQGDLLVRGLSLVQECCNAATARETTGLGLASRREGLDRGWSLPCRGWVKVNADGASALNNGQAAVGGVIRDENGAWLFGFARKIGASTKQIRIMMTHLIF
ncbi:hypothetical protein V6N11_017740 [Hibiscus sabdariffa]|uniref:Reverse transcriptase zinc-binding domain-containing protein n=1 Tax=Hibiscus sabdariffa TaxID=183260 RepID=A0ABR2TZ43_9ROSI